MLSTVRAVIKTASSGKSNCSVDWQSKSPPGRGASRLAIITIPDKAPFHKSPANKKVTVRRAVRASGFTLAFVVINSFYVRAEREIGGFPSDRRRVRLLSSPRGLKLGEVRNLRWSCFRAHRLLGWLFRGRGAAKWITREKTN
jgi:hypothetical protein